ncbi:MAG: PA2169 family four-helix-bundle protein [Burkholderiales bacterium]|nr:PA2169 family four-helix-bundle protein [Bacteroidia bacterium]
MDVKNNNQPFIEAINLLIEINNSREAAYNSVAEETQGSTMKSLFSRLAETSRDCKHELSSELRRLGGIKEELPLLKLYLPWEDLKHMDVKNNRKLVFSSCEFCDRMARKAYEDALDKAEITALSDKALINNQYFMIIEDMNKVSNLKKAFIS